MYLSLILIFSTHWLNWQYYHNSDKCKESQIILTTKQHCIINKYTTKTEFKPG